VEKWAMFVIVLSVNQTRFCLEIVKVQVFNNLNTKVPSNRLRSNARMRHIRRVKGRRWWSGKQRRRSDCPSKKFGTGELKVLLFSRRRRGSVKRLGFRERREIGIVLRRSRNVFGELIFYDIGGVSGL
jgi:hypothetical protein